MIHAVALPGNVRGPDMHLSAKQFAELLSGLDKNFRDASFGGCDKRRAPRVALNNRVTIIPDVPGENCGPVGVEMRDVSQRGLRFFHSRAFPSGTQFVLELPQPTGDPVRILCRVVHSRTTPEGPISIGAEFTCVLRPGKQPKLAVATTAAERERIRQSILD